MTVLNVSLPFGLKSRCFSSTIRFLDASVLEYYFKKQTRRSVREKAKTRQELISSTIFKSKAMN